MNLPKIFINISKILVSVGILILGFVGYQLWGTGIIHARAQDSLSNDFLKLQTSAISPTLNGDTSNEQVIQSIAQRGNFVEGQKYEFNPAVGDALPNLYREKGRAIAQITNKRIGLNEVVVEGTEVNDLKKGPGHYATTPFPGQPGNAAIAGHRTTFGAPFAGLQKLQVGDEILVTTLQGIFTYKVIESGENGQAYKVIDPSEREELDYQGGNHLTLTSCHPRFSASERIIVRAELVGEPAFPFPRDFKNINTAELGTVPLGVAGNIGLGGNRSAVLPAILIGLLLVVLVVGMIIWSRRWNRFAVYGISVLPLFTTIIFLYFFANNALPAY